ncbi:MEKK [Handroanthus impetiginosus]|uniref:MEKK n=1 Tax=Handroanthus impetiginosus TaxID=429701 RepID=A0A2G9GVN2_9LAMI|nr:MEKK [Handroanthus impetiginosus]
MAKAQFGVLDGRYSDSSFSRKPGIVRQFCAKRRWRVVSLVFRFVAALRRDSEMRMDNAWEGGCEDALMASNFWVVVPCDDRFLGSGSISRASEAFAFVDDGLFLTGEEDWADLESISDSSNDGQDGDFVWLTGKNGSFSPNRSVLCNKSWQKGDLLGSGSIGFVYEGFTEDGFFFAVKEVSLLEQGSQGQQMLSNLEQEIFLLRQLRHENIVRYLGTDKDDAKLYIFLELVAKGSLAKLYEKYKLGDSQVSAYTRQILNGLNYLHSENVVHRDIKCANILVDASGSVKLADFGLAKVTILNDIKSCKGTPRWMAPEVVNQKNHQGYGLAADIWSLGCTVLEMLTCRFPYSDLEEVAAVFRIGKGELPPMPDTLSNDARDFILKCLQVNPEDRPTAAQLLEHPFVNKPPSTFPSPISPHHGALPRV